MIGEESAALVAKLEDDIDEHIYKRIEIFQEYAGDLTLQEFTRKSNQEFENLADRQAYIDQKDQEWLSTPKDVLNPFMKELVNNRLSQALREKIDFYNKRGGHAVYGEVFVTNKYGANLAQTNKTSDYRQDDESWWQQAKEHGFYGSNPMHDESAGIYAISVGIRIDDADGNFIGVMKIILNIEEVFHIIDEVTRTVHRQGVSYLLLSKNYDIIYKTGSHMPVDMKDELFLKKIKEAGSGYFLGRLDASKKRLIVYASSEGIKKYEGLDWILVAVHDAQIRFVAIERLKSVIMLSFLIMFCIILLIGFVISRSISSPLSKLTEATVKVSHQQLDTRIVLKTGDEIEILANSFNTMLDNLRTSQDNLRNEEERLRTTLQSIGDGVIATDIDGRIVAMNDVAAILTGWNFKESKGRLFQDVFNIINEKTRKPCPNPVQAAIQADRIIELSNDTLLISRDGTERVIEDTAAPIRNANGNILGVVLVFRDNTEKKRSLEEVRKLSKAVTSSPSSIFITDTQGIIEYVNPKFTELTGYTNKEVVGTKARVLKFEELLSSEHTKMWASIRSGGEWRTEFKNKKKNGDFYWELVFISAIKDEYENVTHFLIVMEDITKRKTAEEAVVAKNKEMEIIMKDLEERTDSLGRFQNITVGRELEMVKLKEEVNQLMKELGHPPKYKAPDMIKDDSL